MRSYLDHNATSTLRPEAKAAMLRAMDCPGNASSVHGEGRAARKVLDDAREQVARAVGVIAPMVVFLASHKTSYVTCQSILVDGGIARGLI